METRYLRAARRLRAEGRCRFSEDPAGARSCWERAFKRPICPRGSNQPPLFRTDAAHSLRPGALGEGAAEVMGCAGRRVEGGDWEVGRPCRPQPADTRRRAALDQVATGDRIGPWVISARASIGRDNFNVWLDRGGAVHVLATCGRA
jgi:hypothetical protein